MIRPGVVPRRAAVEAADQPPDPPEQALGRGDPESSRNRPLPSGRRGVRRHPPPGASRPSSTVDAVQGPESARFGRQEPGISRRAQTGL